MDPDEINERRTFRLLPSEEIGFAKPALEFQRADGTVEVRLAAESSAPQPELARSADDPGWWGITVYLPIGATPLALIPDPSAPLL